MNVEQRIELMVQLGRYMSGSETAWEKVKNKAFLENNWFIPEFIDHSVKNIASEFLQRPALEKLLHSPYPFYNFFTTTSYS